MITQEVIERSPIRALERALHGGLGAKRLGVVLARSGVGKTACLVQIGLDALLRGKAVLHVSNEAPVGHLRAYYDELFRGIERVTGLENAANVLLEIERRRLLISQPGPTLRLEKLHEAASVASGALGRDPDVVIVEGFDLETANDSHVEQLRELAWSLGAEMWLSVRTHRHEPVTHPRGFPAPADRFEALIDVMLSLEPQEGRIQLRVIKNHDETGEEPEPLELDAVTMQLVEDPRGLSGSDPRNRERFALHSGGARGAESAFGEMAERYGIREITFSFDAHGSRVRDRGLRVLSESDLRLGDVSLRYVSHRLGRVFPSTPSVRKIIQSIWHQIRPCQQVFVVGQIQEDGTVRGGTGWGAELARRWKKDLYVFDQEKSGWYHWDGTAWVEAEPVIDSPMFAGTGTAHLESNGRAAIEALFERSFGQNLG
jgi:hypothetical protein